MTLRIACILVLYGAVLLTGVSPLFGPTPAQAQSRTEPLSKEVTALEREVKTLAGRIAQLGRQRQELSRYEELLSTQVEKLKAKPPGVVRDAQLKTALKDLRSILASMRNLDHLERILRTTLKTRQVALAQATESEAQALIQEGERAVRADDYKTGQARFAMAMDYLLIRGVARPGQAPPTRYLETRLAIPEDIVLTGDEPPDELLEIAQILQDTSEKIRIAGQSLTRELSYLREEQATLETLLAIQSPGTAEGAETLRRLIARAGRVEGRLNYLKRQFTRHLAQAAELEARARREESALLAP